MPGHAGQKNRRASRLPLLALIAFYGLVMTASPFLHHDFACHQSSRTHCSFCVNSQSAHKVEVGGAPIDQIQRVVGQVELRSALADDRSVPSSVSDRAPPA